MRKSIVSSLTFIIISIMIISCADDGVTPNKNRVKVAAILDLSGHYSQYGEESKRGLELFMNEHPDAKFDITYLDSKADSATSISVFNSIANDTNYKAVVTLTSWVSNVIAPLTESKQILHYAIGSSVANYSTNGNSIRYTGDVSDESLYSIAYLNNFDKIGLMYLNNDFGVGWANTLSNSLGNKLIVNESYPDTKTDFSDILDKMKNSSVDIIVLISAREAIHICQQVKALGISAKLLGNRPILNNELLKEPSAEGLIFTYPDLDENNAAYKSYVAKYNVKPSSFAAEGYDLANSFYNFTQTDGYNPVELYNKYRNYTQKGMFEELKFDNNAQANSKYTLMIIQNGDYSEIK